MTAPDQRRRVNFQIYQLIICLFSKHVIKFKALCNNTKLRYNI